MSLSKHEDGRPVCRVCRRKVEAETGEAKQAVKANIASRECDRLEVMLKSSAPLANVLAALKHASRVHFWMSTHSRLEPPDSNFQREVDLFEIEHHRVSPNR